MAPAALAQGELAEAGVTSVRQDGARDLVRPDDLDHVAGALDPAQLAPGDAGPPTPDGALRTSAVVNSTWRRFLPRIPGETT
jgi:hypothetical protein